METVGTARRWIVPSGWIAIGASALVYGFIPFDGNSLSSGPGCFNLFYSERCRGALPSLFADGLCGEYARHRFVVFLGIAGLGASFGILLTARQAASRFRPRSTAAVLGFRVLSSALGVTAGLWARGLFAECNNHFVSGWEAIAGGFGVGAVCYFGSLWFLGRRGGVQV